MAGIGLSHVGISDRKLRIQLASLLVVASAIIPNSIVDMANIVCFLDFQATSPPAILKIQPLVSLDSYERKFQSASL